MNLSILSTACHILFSFCQVKRPCRRADSNLARRFSQQITFPNLHEFWRKNALLIAKILQLRLNETNQKLTCLNTTSSFIFFLYVFHAEQNLTKTNARLTMQHKNREINEQITVFAWTESIKMTHHKLFPRMLPSYFVHAVSPGMPVSAPPLFVRADSMCHCSFVQRAKGVDV